MKPHQFDPPPGCAEIQDSCDYWEAGMPYDARCGLHRSAHPASPPEPAPCDSFPAEAITTPEERKVTITAEPAPESEEPPRCQYIRCFVRSADTAPYEADRCGASLPCDLHGMEYAPARPDPAPEPEKLRRMVAEELHRAGHCGYDFGPDLTPGCVCWWGDLAALMVCLLERVIREDAEAGSKWAMGCKSFILDHWGLAPSPESAPEPKP